MTLTATPPPGPPRPDPGGADRSRRPPAWKRYGVLAVLLAFAAFWGWALFFASDEAVNKIGDRAWAARAERICAAATEQRQALADYTRIDEPTPQLIRERADVVDAATSVLERMLDEVVAVAPSDPKGAGIVPEWEADYRTYLADRRAYAAGLRASGENQAFFETAHDGIPLSEKVATFAADNEMPACAPPSDLS